MNIGINARFLAETSNGFGNHLANLVRALDAVDSGCRFLLYTNAPLDPVIPPLSDRFSVIRCTLPPGRSFDRYFVRSAEYLANRPDVLHAQQFVYPDFAGNDERRPPVTLTIHDMIPYVFTSPAMLLRHPSSLRFFSLHGLVSRFVYPRAARRAAALFTISEASRRDILRWLDIDAGRIHLVANGLDPDFTSTGNDTDRAALQARLGIDRPYLINFSGMTVRKNIDRLVQAWLSLPAAFRAGHQLVIAGEGTCRRRNLARLARRNRGKNDILLPGRIGKNDLRTLLAGASASAYVSLYEGFGLPILESLATGIPVLTSDTSSMSEVMAGHTVLANPWSRSALARGIATMFDKETELKEKARAARPALSRYDWNESARQMIAVWKKIAQS